MKCYIQESLLVAFFCRVYKPWCKHERVLGEFKRMGAVCKPQENSFLLRRLYSANIPEKKLQFLAVIKREILTSREVLYLDEVLYT